MKIECAKCGYTIYDRECMITISLTRKDEDVRLHKECFSVSAAEKIEQELRENREVVTLSLFRERIK